MSIQGTDKNALPVSETKDERFVASFIPDQKSFREEKSDTGNFGYFSGYASTFGNLDLVDDVIAAGAFASSLKMNPKVKMLWQHDMRQPIGMFSNMKEDAKGLYVEGRINLATEKGAEAYALLKAGDLDSMSIGYRVIKCSWSEDQEIRTLQELNLMEVSIVTFPANPKAVITSVKSEIESAEKLSDVEHILKSRGFKRSESKALVARIKSLDPARDVPSGAKDSDTKLRDAARIEAIKAFTQSLNTVH